MVSGKTYVRNFGMYAMLIIGKDIRNDSGNGYVVGIDKIMVSLIELFKCCYQFGPLIFLAHQPSSVHYPAFC